MAAVACVRMALGPFLTAEIPAGKGELERWRVVDFEDCVKARARCLAGGDRSMMAVARESGEGKREEEGGDQAQRVEECPEDTGSTARAWL